MHYKTVHWRKRIENKPRNYNRKKFNEYNEREIKKNSKISTPKIARTLKIDFQKEVSDETVRRVFRKYGYNGRVARRKPFINKQNRKKRYLFAKEFQNKTFEFWQNVIFTDKSKFNFFVSDGRQIVWRKPNSELLPINLQPTVKHGGGSVMVCGCFSADGVGNLQIIEGIINQYKYIEILRNNLKESAERLGLKDTFQFYQDNDPKHTAYTTRSWLLNNCPKVIKMPPQSPDVNPIENLWAELEARVRKYQIANKIYL